MFIDDECDGPGGVDFDESDGSSCSDDEQHADGQVALRRDRLHLRMH